jgi:hypothetical protein
MSESLSSQRSGAQLTVVTDCLIRQACGDDPVVIAEARKQLVSRVTAMRDCCHPDQNRRTATQKSLSSRSSLGRGCRRFRTESC